jgi:hypothetical protein
LERTFVCDEGAVRNGWTGFADAGGIAHVRSVAVDVTARAAGAHRFVHRVHAFAHRVARSFRARCEKAGTTRLAIGYPDALALCVTAADGMAIVVVTASVSFFAIDDKVHAFRVRVARPALAAPKTA